MVKIPQSLRDVINQEPERFINDYLDVEKIGKSKNPYKEFLKQFKNKFNSTTGLNLWQYVENRYSLLNSMFKHELIQDVIAEEFKGALKRKEAKEFFKEQLEEVTETQEDREEEVERPIKVSPHTRDGKTIKGHVKTMPHKYIERHERFILSRRNFPIKLLADEFNRAFGTSLTSVALRDKRYRLLGRKD